MNRIVMLLVVLLLMTLELGRAQEAPVVAADQVQELKASTPVLIRRTVISGFVLKDKKLLDKIFKENRNKKLSQVQIQAILNKIKSIYLEAGYAGLVEIDYKIRKNILLINVVMLKT
ncbi:MAG: POTRA domain-containing protein [Candidatus Omnitrophota bacterium]